MNKRWRNGSLLVAGVALLVGWTPVQTSPQSVKLQYKATAGQSARYESNFAIQIDAGGQKIEIEAKQIDKITVKSIAANGNITLERESESSEMKMMGEKVDQPDEPKTTSTEVIQPNGTILSYKSSTEDKEQRELGMRMTNASHVMFPDEAVPVGHKWSHTVKENTETGARAGTAQYELLGIEDAKGVKCAKIRMTFEEATGNPVLRSKSTAWVDLASGDEIQSEAEFENVPFGEGAERVYAQAKGRQERISGMLFAGGQASTPSTTTTPEKKDKTIDEVVKDYTKIPGLFTFYRKQESGRDTIYMEVGEAQIGKLLMLQATLSTGTSTQAVAGNPVNDIVFRFMQPDKDRVFIEVPNLAFRANPKLAIDKVVERSFANSYLDAFRVEARQPDRKSILINVSDLFRGDIARISEVFSGGGPLPGMGGGGMSIDREKTYVSALKSFPENVVVESTYNFVKGGGGGSSILSLLQGNVLADPRSSVIKVVYNLWQLPESGYLPRRFDQRVGYFTADYTDFSDPVALDLKVNNILRWNLQKKDPNAALSEPKKPIVFWLDNGIPTEYRTPIRDAFLGWNKAFEKIGFKNAIQVKQMTDKSDFDHADMRYNVIRWVASEGDAYAVALFRSNPITGEIVNASITVDANIVRAFSQESQFMVNPAEIIAGKRPAKLNPHFACEMSKDVMLQAMVGYEALDAAGASAIDKKAYIAQFLRWVVSHEFGHVLGLRHNFVASTELDLDQLANAQLVNEKGTAASVMDYVPFNVSALKQKGVPFWAPTIGTYDYHAIEYGYKPLGATTSEGEKAALSKIASKTNTPGLQWLGDEVADSFDPFVERFDLSKNPIDYWTRMMRVTRYLIFNLDQRAPKQGKSFWDFTRQFNSLLSMYVRGAATSARYVGGMKLTNNFKGDPGQKPVIQPVAAADQRKALAILNTYLFAENAFSFPKEYYGYFTVNPNASPIEQILSGAEDFPVRDRFGSLQESVLRQIFAPDTLTRITNTEFKLGAKADKFGIEEMFSSVGQQVWSEASGGRSVTPLRRDLQRAHLEILLAIVLPQRSPFDNDARMVAWRELKGLKGVLAVASRTAKDPMSKLHYEEALERVTKALDAKVVISVGAGAPAPNPLQALLGGAGKGK